MLYLYAAALSCKDYNGGVYITSCYLTALNDDEAYGITYRTALETWHKYTDHRANVIRIPHEVIMRAYSG